MGNCNHQLRKLKAAVDTLEYLTELVADKDTTIRLLRQLLLPASTEKTKDVLARAGAESTGARTDSKPEGRAEQGKGDPQPGHGRNGAEAFTGARQVQVPHPQMKPGSRTPLSPKPSAPSPITRRQLATPRVWLS